MKSLAIKIDNFFNEISNQHDVQSILNQVFLTLSESKKYGIDSVVESLYYQCIESETSTNGTNLENGWESNDGKHHLAVICVKNDDTQEHCFGEWIENAQGLIVLDKNRDNLDAEEKAKHFLQGSGYMVYATAESEIEDLRDCGYLIVKDGDKGSNPIEDVVEYLETHDYEVSHRDNINNFCIEHLTKENYFVCQGGSDVESLVQLFHKEPEKFSKILMKSYKFKIDLAVKFDIDFEVKAFTLKDAHIKMRERLENACLDVNNSQTYVHINADEIQIIPL